VSTDLDWFTEVIPCGIAGAGVASLTTLGVAPAPRVHEVAGRFAAELARVIGLEPRPAGEAVRTVIAEGIAAAV
jgi:lipoate-protein ligase B